MLDAFIIDEIVKRQSRIDEDDAGQRYKSLSRPVDESPSNRASKMSRK